MPQFCQRYSAHLFPNRQGGRTVPGQSEYSCPMPSWCEPPRFQKQRKNEGTKISIFSHHRTSFYHLLTTIIDFIRKQSITGDSGKTIPRSLFPILQQIIYCHIKSLLHTLFHYGKNLLFQPSFLFFLFLLVFLCVPHL